MDSHNPSQTNSRRPEANSSPPSRARQTPVDAGKRAEADSGAEGRRFESCRGHRFYRHRHRTRGRAPTLIAAAETAAKSSRADQVDALKQLETRQKAVNQLIDAIETQLMKFAPAAVSAPS